ncbi:hypothetical protein M422DRAFT_266284 [Sphaerobolus stellatus SS14]|uniref:Uncharacterized protein n=1 Tax=Sphaerobolus stellatus (strain SS14) TaxID=990650 RepID=A0A0C9V347_SPHS4|nr:hypothetical protein M422DRAFT_266284 [Sphaerobolus stellatus SS14]
MDYPRTRSQMFYSPVTNRLQFSPERSATPPIITNRLEFYSEEESSPASSASLKSVPVTKISVNPPTRRLVKEGSSPLESLAKRHDHPPTAQDIAKTAPEPLIKRRDIPAQEEEYTSEEEENILPTSSELSTIQENDDEEEDTDTDSISPALRHEEAHEQSGDDQSSSDDSEEPEVTTNQLMRKPPGSAGRPGGHGYTLKMELKKRGWTPTHIQDVTAYIRKIAPNYIDIHISYAQQDTAKVDRLFRKVRRRFRLLNLQLYENDWALKDFVQAHIKYARDTFEVESAPGPSRAKRDGEPDTENLVQTKRRRVEGRSSSVPRAPASVRIWICLCWLLTAVNQPTTTNRPVSIPAL